MSRDFEIKVLTNENQVPLSAVERTKAAIREKWSGDKGRQNQAHAFIKRAKKSDARRRMEKATRKKNRRRR